jgi:hypothetical protein
MTYIRKTSYVLAVFFGIASLTSAQQKTSVWQTIKNAANQAQQQKNGQQQGQPADKRGGRTTQNPVNDSGSFKPPAGTNIQVPNLK